MAFDEKFKRELKNIASELTNEISGMSSANHYSGYFTSQVIAEHTNLEKFNQIKSNIDGLQQCYSFEQKLLTDLREYIEYIVENY